MSSAQRSDSKPSKATGQFHSTKGNVKEAIGNTFRAHNLAESGRREHAAGEAEVNAAKARGYAEGTKDRAVGKKDSVVGAVTGDSHQQAAGNARQKHGQNQQDFNRNY